MLSVKPKSLQLWQEIVLTLSFKAVLLAVIWVVWFSAPQEQVADGQQVASHIFSPQPQKEHDHDADARAR